MEQREIKLVGRGERRKPETTKEESVEWRGFTHMVMAAFLVALGWFLIVFSTRAGWLLASKLF